MIGFVWDWSVNNCTQQRLGLLGARTGITGYGPNSIYTSWEVPLPAWLKLLD